jgi:hypothetical protein
LNCFIDNYYQAYDDGQRNNWDGNYWSDLPLQGATYLGIQGSAGSKDYHTLKRCPRKGLGGAQVPAFTPMGMVLLIGLISLLAVTAIRKKQR